MNTLSRAATRAGLAAILVPGAWLLGLGACLAAPITYNVNQTIGLGSVVGTIQTDGATGVLGTGDITAFSLVLNGLNATYTITSASSVVQIVGSDVTATPTELLFNFSGLDDGYLLFQQSLFSGTHYYCDATSSGTCLQGASVVPQSIFDPSAQNMPETGNQVIGVAAAVPEPASAAMLGLGLAALAVRRRRAKAD